MFLGDREPLRMVSLGMSGVGADIPQDPRGSKTDRKEEPWKETRVKNATLGSERPSHLCPLPRPCPQ